MTLRLPGRHVLITGASRGLGRHIAQAMWRNGTNVLLVARDTEALKSLQKELQSQPVLVDTQDDIAKMRMPKYQEALIFSADLSQPDAAKKILAFAREKWQRLDVLVNNAAIQGPIGKSWENDWQEWKQTLTVNLLAPVELCRGAVPWMLENDRGRILNLSGGGSTGPRPNFSAYATAKTGLVRFSETLAMELAGTGVCVNSIAPGVMNTQMLEEIVKTGPRASGEKEHFEARKAQATVQSAPPRAAELCVSLASPETGALSGKLISAAWDPWEQLHQYFGEIAKSDIYTLRRIVPADRGKNWGKV